MTDLEDLRHLIQQIQGDLKHLIQENEQNQRQFQEMQAQINRLHVERYSGGQGKEADTDGISPYYYGWRRYFGTFLWTLVIVGLIIGCGWNLGEILQDMMESTTVTKITYTLHDKLPIPPIFVFHQSSNTPMLHTEKHFKALENGSLTEAYLEAIIKGIGIRPFDEQYITVQPSEITDAYKQAILRYGSLTEAALALYNEYGIACDELFILCTYDLALPMNCCDIFEFLWGLKGPQYALKWNTINLDAYRFVSVHLRILPNIKALQEGDFVQEPRNYGSYWIGIGNGVDQTGYDGHAFEVQLSETALIMLRQKRRNLKVSKDCFDIPPKLRYFRDYTINNCYYEQCYLNKLPLCNISCELPLLQLLSPENFSGTPCEFDAINSTCWTLIQADQLQCITNHRCRFPCNHTDVEYSVMKGLQSGNQRYIELNFKYDTTEVQTFEETSRLTIWEYLGLISSILDLWLGITIYTLYRMLHRAVSKITQFKSYDFGKNNSAPAHVASADQQHEMDNFSNTERDRRIRSSHRSYY